MLPALPSAEFVRQPAGFTARTAQAHYFISPDGFRITPADHGHPFEFRWSPAPGRRVDGAGTPRGPVNLYVGRNPKDWRPGTPVYAQVRTAPLYPGIDATYYFQGSLFEFDLVIRPGADPRTARLTLAGAQPRWRLQPGGAVSLTHAGRDFRLRPPQAYQLDGAVPHPVRCRYRLDANGTLGFMVGSYDHRRDLIIDPVLEFLTYLGGDREDLIQAVAIDSGGNVIVAGVTNSSNLPDVDSAGGEAIFITKLDATGTRRLYTTVLGGIKGLRPVYGADSVQALIADPSGDVFVAGSTLSSNFPATPGAWRRATTGGYAARLDVNGQLTYATLLGGDSRSLLHPLFARARDGVLYLAGITEQREFFGTPGAYQREAAGLPDLFLLALEPDGSGPRFLTALGGSGTEALKHLLLTPEGQPVIVGRTTSPDFPVTYDAWPEEPAGSDQTKATLTIFDQTGGSLVYSTLLGPVEPSAAAEIPGGDYLLAFRGALPDAILADTPVATLPPASPEYPDMPYFVARFSGTMHRPDWVTKTGVWASELAADADGHAYWIQLPGREWWVGGGASVLPGSAGLMKLSTDGSRLLFAAAMPESSHLAVSPGGRVAVAGSTNSALLPTTPNAVQPERDPAPTILGSKYWNQNDGWIGLLNLDPFRDANFFLTSQRRSFTWRIGTPAPDEVVVPLRLSGDPGPLTARSSNEERLAAYYTNDPEPAVHLSVPVTQTTPGAFDETVTIEAVDIDAAYSMPVELNVKRAVDFALAQSSVELRFRQGQDRTGIVPVTVPITKDFGDEYFYFHTESSDPRFYPSINGGGPRLDVYMAELPAGEYEATISVWLESLPSVRHDLLLRVTVDPPAKLTVAPATFRLQAVQGQQFPTDSSLRITSDVPGSGWTIFVGMCPAWMTIRQSATTAPGQVLIDIDTASAPPGVYPVSIMISSEDRTSTTVTVEVVVSSGALLDVTPPSISRDLIRNPYTVAPVWQVAIVTPQPTAFEWSADESWVLPQYHSGTTPALIYLGFSTNLPEGRRQATLTIRANGATRQIPLTWNLFDTPHLVYPVDPLHFTYQQGGPQPDPQVFQVTCPTLMAGVFYVSARPYGSFVDVSATGVITPGLVTVKVKTENLAPGHYEAAVGVAGGYPDGSRYDSIPVTLDILPDPNAPTALLATVAGAASLLPGAVAPGEIVLLSGTGFGPEPSADAVPGENGFYPSEFAGIKVYFGDIPAPILAAGPGRVQVVAPFELSGRASTAITLETGGRRSTVLTAPVAATNPALFTADGTGLGPARMETEEDGAVVVLHATGLGLLNPPAANGAVISDPPPAFVPEISVYVGGRAAELLSATAEPGQVAGMARLRIRLPDGLKAGPQPVIVLAGENPSQPGVTLER